MANEATPIEGPYEIHDFDVYDSQAIEKGSIMVFSGSRACKISTAANDKFAGIAMSEKVAGDGQTRVGLATTGIFDCYFDAATGAAVGSHVSISGANTIKLYVTLDGEKGAEVGKSLEIWTAGTKSEVMLI